MSDIMALKQSIFDLVEESRKQLAQGHVDLSPVEDGVRAYCEALNAIPRAEAQPHINDLQTLSEAINSLEKALKSEQISVKAQLTELGRHKKANNAYVKSDGIGEKYFAPEEPEEP